MLALLTLGSCDSRIKPQYPIQAHVCDFFENTQDMQVIWQGIEKEEVPDVQWQIPSEYLRRHYGGQSDGSILLRVRITDFAPFVAEYTGERTEISENFGTLLFRSIVDAERIAILKLRLTYSLTEEIDFGPALEKAKDAKYGLKQFFVEDFDAAYFYPENFFIALGDGGVTDVIGCSSIGSVPFPRCSHEFRSEYADIMIGYGLDFLPEWRAIRDRAEMFARCAFVATK